MTEDPRISEIRAVLTEYVRTDDLDALFGVRQHIRAIVDRPAPAPRVFFPGDTVPAGVEGRAKDGDIYRWRDDRVLQPYFSPLVEIPQMSDEDWQAAVDRARAEREVQS